MSADRREPRIVLTTAGVAEAERLAGALVDERLAACVNRVAVASTYRWRGGVENDDEVLLIIKTTDDLVEALAARLGELHSYEVAELVVLEPAAMGEDYLDWLLESCG
jgi:periplasmic divalent cation tolerance protein